MLIMTYSHDPFTWLIHSYVWHASLTWLIHVTYPRGSVTWIIHMTYSIHMTQLIQMINRYQQDHLLVECLTTKINMKQTNQYETNKSIWNKQINMKQTNQYETNNSIYVPRVFHVTHSHDAPTRMCDRTHSHNSFTSPIHQCLRTSHEINI